MTSATTAVVKAPAPLIIMLRCQCFCCLRSRHQCKTIPDCDKVNETKTPTANRLINAFVSPRKTTSNKAARQASTIIPTEKDKRSPRKANCLGKNRSRANKDDRRGKSEKLVSAD